MKLVHTVEQWNPLWISHIQKNHRIGLIPTMGALHEGHLDLVRRSLQKTDVSIVSIFVNPIQFNNPEDFAKYPATLDQDLEKLRNLGVQYVFVPNVKSIYESLPQLKMDFGDLLNKVKMVDIDDAILAPLKSKDFEGFIRMGMEYADMVVKGSEVPAELNQLFQDFSKDKKLEISIEEEQQAHEDLYGVYTSLAG